MKLIVDAASLIERQINPLLTSSSKSGAKPTGRCYRPRSACMIILPSAVCTISPHAWSTEGSDSSAANEILKVPRARFAMRLVGPKPISGPVRSMQSHELSRPVD
jgi:hypothetical protein